MVTSPHHRSLWSVSFGKLLLLVLVQTFDRSAASSELLAVPPQTCSSNNAASKECQAPQPANKASHQNRSTSTDLGSVSSISEDGEGAAGDEEYEYDDEEERWEWFFSAYGKPQVIHTGPTQKAVEDALDKMEKYMKEVVLVDKKYENIRYECRNQDSLCSQWAVEGRCDSEQEMMIYQCSPVCGTCDKLETLLLAEEVEHDEYEYFGEEDEYHEGGDEDDWEYDYDEDEGAPASKEVGRLVTINWGIRQNLGTMFPEKVQNVLNETREYMTHTVYIEEKYDAVVEECENRYQDCSYWAAFGECDKSKDFMQINCAPACRTCEMLDVEYRCPLDPNAHHVLEEEGDLDTIFEKITTDPKWNETYGPMTILSSPDTTGGPWVVTLDNFVTDKECDRLIEIGTEEGYEVSTNVAADLEFDGSLATETSRGRTSTNAWCTDSCQTDPISGPVLTRIEDLTGIPYNHSEWLQLLRYKEGQFYNKHHDYIDLEWDRPQGPRVLTVFLYLNDVEAGGGTGFPFLETIVMPKRGRLLLWPSVLNDDPLEKDFRTLHEALPVEAGVKYGANAWLHLRDFKTPNLKSCT